jgi:hypothetical protein
MEITQQIVSWTCGELPTIPKTILCSMMAVATTAQGLIIASQ